MMLNSTPKASDDGLAKYDNEFNEENRIVGILSHFINEIEDATKFQYRTTMTPNRSRQQIDQSPKQRSQFNQYLSLAMPHSNSLDRIK